MVADKKAAILITKDSIQFLTSVRLICTTEYTDTETGGAYLPSQLEHTVYSTTLYVRDSRYSERGWACTPTLASPG